MLTICFHFFHCQFCVGFFFRVVLSDFLSNGSRLRILVLCAEDELVGLLVLLLGGGEGHRSRRLCCIRDCRWRRRRSLSLRLVRVTRRIRGHRHSSSSNNNSNNNSNSDGLLRWMKTMTMTMTMMTTMRTSVSDGDESSLFGGECHLDMIYQFPCVRFPCVNFFFFLVSLVSLSLLLSHEHTISPHFTTGDLIPLNHHDERVAFVYVCRMCLEFVSVSSTVSSYGSSYHADARKPSIHPSIHYLFLPFLLYMYVFPSRRLSFHSCSIFVSVLSNRSTDSSSSITSIHIPWFLLPLMYISLIQLYTVPHTGTRPHRFSSVRILCFAFMFCHDSRPCFLLS